MKEISKDKLRQAGRYLDEKPPILSTKESCKEEYWRQLIDALPFRLYTNVQIETFAEELFGPTGSPGLRLLVDLRERGLEYEPFLEALEQIKCFKALNLFVQSTVPVIDTQPESTSISPGGTLVLSCIGRCDPPSPSYQWYWNNQAIPNKRSHNLVINNVHANITGLYKCKVSNDRIPNPNYNHIWSKEIKVEIVKHPIPECGDDKPMEELPLGEPSLEERPLSYTSQYSSSIPCTSDTSNDTTTTTDNTTLDSSSTISLLSRSGRNSLPTTPVNLGRHPSSTLPSTVEISGDIEITKKFNDIKCRYDRPFTLECQARSKIGKELTFTWKLEKGKKPQILKQVDSVTTSVLTHEYDRHGTLTICCEITHTDKTTDDKAINRAKVDVETVWIVEEPESIRGYAGDTVSLTCKAEGKGPITYLWLKSKSNGQKKQKSKGPSKDREYRMVLEPEAWGLYICQAENSDGFVSSKEVSVQFDATDKKRADLRIIVQPLSIVCEKGSNVTLSCKAEPHDRRTHYQWFFKNNQMRHSDSDSDSLIIHNVNDNHFGDYYCQVTNRGKTIKSNKVTLYLGRNRPNLDGKKNETQKNQTKAEASFVTDDDNISYARDKVALLIGNQNYKYMSSLTSPRNDISELKNTLSKMNFRVFAYYDLSLNEIMHLITKTCAMLGPGVYLFFYYSGHGFHYQRFGIDYIIPIDVKNEPSLMCSECLSISYITYQFQMTLCKVFTFFDCCRGSFKSDKVLAPKIGSKDSIACSNLLQILSCNAHNSAYERQSEACSVFNKALRSGLEKKLNVVGELGGHILETMQQQSQSKNGTEFQRPETISKMLPIRITLHEEIMLESWATNPPFDIRINREQLYSVPGEAILVLDGLATATVTFNYVAINCLRVWSRPINEGQCQKMDVKIKIMNLESTNHEDENGPKVVRPKNDQPEIIIHFIEGIQRFNQEWLKLQVELVATNNVEQEFTTPQNIDIRNYTFSETSE